MSWNQQFVTEYDEALIEEFDHGPESAPSYQLKAGIERTSLTSYASVRQSGCSGDADDRWLLDEVTDDGMNAADGATGGLLYDIGVSDSAEAPEFTHLNVRLSEIASLEPLEGKCLHTRAKFISDGTLRPSYWGLSYVKYQHLESSSITIPELDDINYPEIAILAAKLEEILNDLGLECPVEICGN
jgi:hypothetical protein